MELCRKCEGLGMLLAKVKGEGTETIVFCDCKTPRIYEWKLATLNNKIREAFDLSRCPGEWFKPSRKEPFRIATVDQKILTWQAKLKSAEKFWKEWQQIFEEQARPHWSANY